MTQTDRPATALELGLTQSALAPDGRQVTLSNWQQAPWNRWAFQHVRQLVPSARVSRGELPVWELPAEPVNLDGLGFETVTGGGTTVAGLLERGHADGFLVLHRGRIVAEQYFNGMTRDTPHLLQSISKSFTGSLAGALAGGGLLTPDRRLTECVGELADSSFEGATVRHLLDMSAGTRFSEDYDDPHADVNQYEAAVGWRPEPHGDGHGDLLDYILGLPNARAHGEAFEYRSILTDLLGIVIERLAGAPFADVLSDRIWAQLGAERDAEITVDRSGNALADGGLSVTLRDLGRFGQMILQGGCVEGRQLVPVAWINDTRYADEAWRQTFLASEESQRLCESTAPSCFPRGHYRNQWWVIDPDLGVLLASGIFGQSLYINLFASVVVAVVSSHTQAFDAELSADVLRACAAMSGALSIL
jgi:CubicO group peptidase (beta-lactamase class C family)